MAATIVVATAAAMLLVSSRGADWHETARGSRSVVHLPDGSSIEVNTDSRVGVSYSATGRNVTLEKGEALFEVGHDALLRPFTVRVRNGASARRIESWRKDRWSFDGWSLERAAREHNRYVNKPIRIDDAELAQKRISGVFRIGDTDAFLTAVSRNAHAEVVDQGDSLLLVPAEE